MTADQGPPMGAKSRRPAPAALGLREAVLGVVFFTLVWATAGAIFIVLIWLLQQAGVWALPEGDVEPTATAVVGSVARRLPGGGRL
jgi:hypothetical protein